MRAVIWREGWFIKNQACLDDLRIMDIVIGFMMRPALG